jgi:hypothetical protein
MPEGPLRIGALYVPWLFVVFYIVTVAQIVWVCEMNEELSSTGYVLFFVSTLRIHLTLLCTILIQYSTMLCQGTSGHLSNDM